MSSGMTPEHWTDAEALLSAYILGRVAPEEQEEMERHLASCPSCAAAVRRELVLAAGAKRLGRARLREDLSRRIIAARGSAFPWRPVLGAAAVLVVAAGLAVVNRWFIFESRTVPPDAGPVITEIPGPPKTSGEASGQVAEPDRGRPAEPRVKKKTLPALPSPAEDAVQQAETKLSLSVAAGEPGRDEYWSLAVPVSPALSKGRAMEKGGKFEAETMHEGFAGDTAAFVIRQADPGERPAGGADSGSGAGGFAVRIVRQDGRTMVTLFPPAPIDSSDLRGARIERTEEGVISLLMAGKAYRIRTQGISPGGRRR